MKKKFFVLLCIMIMLVTLNTGIVYANIKAPYNISSIAGIYKYDTANNKYENEWLKVGEDIPAGMYKVTVQNRGLISISRGSGDFASNYFQVDGNYPEGRYVSASLNSQPNGSIVTVGNKDTIYLAKAIVQFETTQGSNNYIVNTNSKRPQNNSSISGLYEYDTLNHTYTDSYLKAGEDIPAGTYKVTVLSNKGLVSATRDSGNHDQFFQISGYNPQGDYTGPYPYLPNGSTIIVNNKDTIWLTSIVVRFERQ